MFFIPLLGLLVKGALLGAGGVVAAAAISVAYDSICECITQESAKEHLENVISEKLRNNDYSTVNLSLTATVIDISHTSEETRVAFDIEGEQYGLCSRNGTTLTLNEQIQLCD